MHGYSAFKENPQTKQRVRNFATEFNTNAASASSLWSSVNFAFRLRRDIFSHHGEGSSATRQCEYIHTFLIKVTNTPKYLK